MVLELLSPNFSLILIGIAGNDNGKFVVNARLVDNDCGNTGTSLIFVEFNGNLDDNTPKNTGGSAILADPDILVTEVAIGIIAILVAVNPILIKFVVVKTFEKVDAQLGEVLE